MRFWAASCLIVCCLSAQTTASGTAVVALRSPRELFVAVDSLETWKQADSPSEPAPGSGKRTGCKVAAAGPLFAIVAGLFHVSPDPSSAFPFSNSIQGVTGASPRQGACRKTIRILPRRAKRDRRLHARHHRLDASPWDRALAILILEYAPRPEGSMCQSCCCASSFASLALLGVMVMWQRIELCAVKAPRPVSAYKVDSFNGGSAIIHGVIAFEVARYFRSCATSVRRSGRVFGRPDPSITESLIEEARGVWRAGKCRALAVKYSSFSLCSRSLRP
jgi:hypothetical protein